MENMTIQQKVVRSHAGLDPLEGYALVVYEQMGESGAEFRQVVKPGERFNLPKPGLRSFFKNSAQNYLAIAVRMAEELRLDFGDHFELDDKIHDFDLRFELNYSVKDPEIVATTRNEDPLRQLREEVIRAIRYRIVRYEWEAIKTEFRKTEEKVVQDAFKGLMEFAERIGFCIKSIVLHAQIPQKWLETEIAREKVEIENDLHKTKEDANRIRMTETFKTEDLISSREEEKQLQDIEKTFSIEATKRKWEQENRDQDMFYQAAATKKTLETERELEKLKLENTFMIETTKRRWEQENRELQMLYQAAATKKSLENESELQELKNQIHLSEQNRKVWESMANASTRALENVGGNIQSPSDLQDALAVIAQNRRVFQISAPTQPMLDATESGPHENSTAFMFSHGEKYQWIKTVVQDLSEVNGWGYPFEQTRNLCSGMLHMIAEALLDDRAKEDTLKEYSDRVYELSRTLDPALSPKQNRVLEKFWKTEQLRAQFK